MKFASAMVPVGAALVLSGLTTFGLARAQDGGDPPQPAPVAKGDDAPAPVLAKGRVLFEGELPATKELTVPEKAAAGCCPPGEEVDRTDLSLLISKERGIANCVVTVTVPDVEVEVPEAPFLMDQKGCRFVPHLLVVPVGAKVEFLNSDETAHNVHTKSVLNEPINQTVAAGKRIEKEFEKGEAVKVACDMHSWMSAWLVVTDATHWAVSDADGNFALADLPPGKHEATVWHETLGAKKIEIVVGENGVAEPVEVELSKGESKKSNRRRRR